MKSTDFEELSRFLLVKMWFSGKACLWELMAELFYFVMLDCYKSTAFAGKGMLYVKVLLHPLWLSGRFVG